MQVNILEAKNRLSQLVKLATSGEEVVIANRGQPIVKLVALQAPAPADTGNALLAWLQAHPLPAQLRRSAVDADAALRMERNAWD
jgi:prevent-host-death family protein